MAKANGRGAAGDKAKALELAMSQIEKQYGKGSIMRLGDEGGIQEIECISTGSLAVDAALGIGGLPRGRIVEISGPEGAGKTMLALHAIREAQKQGGTAAFIDAEHALDVTFARRIGVDVENLIISQPDSGEQALEIVDTLVRSGAFDIIVVDSVAALVPQAELEGDMGDSHMGLHARLMSQALRKLTSSLARSHTCLIFINQLRMKIGVMFGSPETTTGGRALPFYSSVRIDIRRIARVKDGDIDIGNRTRVKIVKNKVAPPFREAEFDLIFHGDDIGISFHGDLIDIGVDKGFVDKSGAWFSYNGERLGQGRDNAKNFLLEHPAIATEIEGRLRVELGLKAAPAGGEAEGEDEETAE
ncbi:MAG: recombinase RecA [Candidatus Latescibacterota bacterium]|nr:recombinase RecA [Candidatus Latescibacterota bacterium]